MQFRKCVCENQKKQETLTINNKQDYTQSKCLYNRLSSIHYHQYTIINTHDPMSKLWTKIKTLLVCLYTSGPIVGPIILIRGKGYGSRDTCICTCTCIHAFTHLLAV